MVFEFKPKWSRLNLLFITNTRLIRNKKAEKQSLKESEG